MNKSKLRYSFELPNGELEGKLYPLTVVITYKQRMSQILACLSHGETCGAHICLCGFLNK